MSNRIALYHPSAGVQPKANPFGKDVANVELFRAVLRHGDYEQIDFMVGGNVSAQALVSGLLGQEPARPRVAVANLLDQRPAAAGGALVRGHPDLADMAWYRRNAGLEHAYSMLGMVHTLAPPFMRETIAKAAIAPIQPWDALICTSPTVQDALGTMFDDWTDYLADRYGGQTRIKPHLPLLPLGVDGKAFADLADRPDARAAMRAELGAAPEDVVVLWVGRLSFFEKAFPQPMFRAAEEAARATGAKVHFAMVGWFPADERDRAWYREAAEAYSPSVVTHFLDGNDRNVVGGMWAAGDIFLSLVDNIQETFGITPLEAMAAGLPVVVSDWDGYRYTVRDGVDGFLVRSLGGPVGAGQGMINRHTLGGLAYQAYVGAVAQHTAINVGDAAARIAELIASPELRAKMRDAGRKRIAETFDWPVVVRGLQNLTKELDAIRAAATPGPIKHQFNPVKREPFGAFAGFPNSALNTGTRVWLREGVTSADLEATRKLNLDQFASGWRASHEESAMIMTMLAERGPLTVGELVEAAGSGRRQLFALAIVWMCKLGLLDWSAT